MPMPPTSSEYVEVMYHHFADRLNAHQAYLKIEEEYGQDGQRRLDVPSERTVSNYLKKWRDMTDEQRAGWGTFHWPQSMRLSLVPWEASRPALDLVRWRTRQQRRAPTIGEALWFWRVRLAAPSLSTEETDRWASLFASYDYAERVTGDGWQDVEPIEMFLAFEPWVSEENYAAFKETARERGWPSWYGEGNDIYAVTVPLEPEALRRFLTSQYGERLGNMMARGALERNAELRRLATGQDSQDTKA